MNVESWCTVERIASQGWTRAERKHNPNAFNSSVFKPDEKKQSDRLLDLRSEDVAHKEKRHFSDKYETEFKM